MPQIFVKTVFSHAKIANIMEEIVLHVQVMLKIEQIPLIVNVSQDFTQKEIYVLDVNCPVALVLGKKSA